MLARIRELLTDAQVHLQDLEKEQKSSKEGKVSSHVDASKKLVGMADDDVIALIDSLKEIVGQIEDLSFRVKDEVIEKDEAFQELNDIHALLDALL